MDGFKLSFYNGSLELLCIHNRKIAGIEHKVVGNYYFWMWIAGVWLLLCNRRLLSCDSGLWGYIYIALPPGWKLYIAKVMAVFGIDKILYSWI